MAVPYAHQFVCTTSLEIIHGEFREPSLCLVTSGNTRMEFVDGHYEGVYFLIIPASHSFHSGSCVTPPLHRIPARENSCCRGELEGWIDGVPYAVDQSSD